jgi:hypothetical protein
MIMVAGHTGRMGETNYIKKTDSKEGIKRKYSCV